jgi:hypothetical protein
MARAIPALAHHGGAHSSHGWSDAERADLIRAVEGFTRAQDQRGESVPCGAAGSGIECMRGTGKAPQF